MANRVTRRDFLKAGGAALAGPGLASGLLPTAAGAPPERATHIGTNATYFNNAASPAADPHVRYDEPSGYYYAYSTVGGGRDADGRRYYFGIYRSPDLATWEHVPGGAIPVDDPNNWGKDWFWAPEVYYNADTEVYFFFYSAREHATASKRDFGFADFEEPCRIGVATSRSPAGPFLNITDQPIDYHPYDPDYHDVNQIMGPDQKQPPATLEEGRTAPQGVYIPAIDASLFFDDGRIYLYYSRNAYRNWVWDTDLDKYIEESNILAVELTTDWWRDRAGASMPTITADYRGANAGPGGPAGPRRDGWVQIISYAEDKQAWENAHVNDYEESGGRKKNRRWSEGSTTIRSGTDAGGRPLYFLTYSANNFASPDYGVGYATASGPLGPWTKYAGNPILAADPSLPMYSTGHGSIATTPDGAETYYVHHGRPSPTASPRRLYTDRLFLSGTPLDADGRPTMVIEQSTSDEPVPSGVAPYSLTTSTQQVGPRTVHVSWRVTSASGAELSLDNPLNRVTAVLDRPGTIALDDDGAGATVTLHGRRAARLTATYQRQLASGSYEDTVNIRRTPSGKERREPVAATVPIAPRPR